MSNTALYLTTVLIWGSTWLAIEYQLGVVEPEVSIVYRYVMASAILFIYCKFKDLKLSFNLKSHLWFALLGAFLFCLPYVFAYRAQIHITSALAAIAFSTIVWINIVLSRLIFGTRIRRRVLTGALLGIVGIVTLFAPQISDVSWSDRVFYGSALAFLGALTASAGNILSEGAQARALPVLQTNAWGMLYGAILTGIISVFRGHEFAFDASITYIVSLLYLAVFGSVVAFGAYLTLLGRIGAHRAGYATVMFPVVALTLSIMFEGLGLELTIVLGTALVLLGNLLVLKEEQ
ncbi:MAG: EamA family transporter [Gammaproteobacteria bacterium]|nr:EamA family transporter [Gammaproteobacteria bacterium]